MRIDINILPTAQTISHQIYGCSQRTCKEAVDVLKKCEQIESQALSTKITNDIGESYYQLALFCLKQSKSTESDDNQTDFQKLLIVSVLRGMRHGSKNARLQFPRLLQLSNINSTELKTIFEEEVIVLYIFHRSKKSSTQN